MTIDVSIEFTGNYGKCTTCARFVDTEDGGYCPLEEQGRDCIYIKAPRPYDPTFDD